MMATTKTGSDIETTKTASDTAKSEAEASAPRDPSLAIPPDVMPRYLQPVDAGPRLPGRPEDQVQK